MGEKVKNKNSKEKNELVEKELKILKEKYEKFLSIFNNTPVGVFQINVDGEFIEINNTLSELLGFISVEEAIKYINNSKNQIYSNIQKRKDLILELQKDSSDPVNFEINYEKKNERTIPLNFIIRAIKNKKGKILFFSGIVEDISDRKYMEKSLIEREEQITALLRNSSDSITIVDKNGIILFESSTRNKILEFSNKELIGKSFLDIIHPDDKADFILVFQRVLKNPNRKEKKEYRSLHKNKKWIYVESILSNHLENKAINGIIVNSRDISERKLGELKERVYHDNLIFLSNSTLDLLGLSLKDEIFQFISNKLYDFLEKSIIIVSSYQEDINSFRIEQVACSEIVKLTIKRIAGTDLIGIIFPQTTRFSSLDSAGVVHTVLKDEIHLSGIGHVKNLDAFSIIEYLKIHKIYYISLARNQKLLGNIIILTLNKTIIKFKHIIETFVHQVSIAIQRAQLESELIRAKEKAEESDKIKTTFLANMSHEIRTPMNGILGFAEMLNDENISPANRHKYLDIIYGNGKMLVNLIDDIIDFAKLEAKQISINEQVFSLNILLNQIHSSFLSKNLRNETENVEIRMYKQFDNNNSFIKSDPTRLRQIFTNLLANSIKFTNKGFIEFGYKKKNNNTLLFYVKDSGIGIPTDKLDVIFERFIQADDSSTRKYGGSGLGLAISKGLVEILKGKMWAESKLNKGSVFYFTIPYFPAKKISSDDTIQVEKIKSNYIWEGKLFLIAEDDYFSYKFLEGFLVKTNATIIHAKDGREAIDLCKKYKNIDLILMDIQMPEINGIQATEEIKKINRKIPIIAQTANAIIEEKKKCFDAGCDDFITKPVNIKELYAKIDKWMTL